MVLAMLEDHFEYDPCCHRHGRASARAQQTRQGNAKLTGFDWRLLAWLTHPGSSRESNGLGSVEAVARGIHRAPAVGGWARAAVSLSHGLARTGRGRVAVASSPG